MTLYLRFEPKISYNNEWVLTIPLQCLLVTRNTIIMKMSGNWNIIKLNCGYVLKLKRNLILIVKVLRVVNVFHFLCVWLKIRFKQCSITSKVMVGSSLSFYWQHHMINWGISAGNLFRLIPFSFSLSTFARAYLVIVIIILLTTSRF